jgi:hypothetical protein
MILSSSPRETIGGLAIRAGNETIGITCSVGAAEWEPGDTIDSLLRRQICRFMRPNVWAAIELSLPTAFQWSKSTNGGAASLGWPHVAQNDAIHAWR